MNNLNNEPPNQSENLAALQNNPYLKRIGKIKKDFFMKTPCNHSFHNKCLINWMSIKMECPTCRKNLPIL